MKIAYLAPEIPALSATFVYEELQGLERRGYTVLPLSVQVPQPPARGQEALARRTLIVYDRPKWRLALAGLLALPGQGGVRKALAWLWADLRQCGLLSAAAGKLAFQFLAAARVARLLQQHRCRHLHVHFVHVPTQIAMYASALSGVPFTCTAHANDIFERGLLLPQKAERALRMLTISRHNLAYLRHLGVDEQKLAVVRCGIDLPAPRPRPAAPEQKRFRLGSLGRLVEKKGMDVLLRAVAALADRPYEIELCIAGDGPWRGKLETLAAGLGLAPRVRFVGSLPHRAVAAWLGELDAFVLACKQDRHGDMDGIPVVLMEAMSQGIPVVSTRLSGIPELVIDGATGLLAAPGDAPGLAAQLDRLLQSSELRSRLAAQAIEHVRAEFGRDINLDRLLACLGMRSQRAAGQEDLRGRTMQANYLLISPCRNEAEYMRQTLDTVIAQSLRPSKWIIVDDGSSDATPAILEEYRRRHDWIEIVTRPDRGRRAVGPGVIEAFYAGYERIVPDDYQYLCKLDLDLRLPPRYFATLIERMQANPRLGTCSGKAYVERKGGLVSEGHGDETSLGMTKFYRVACFKEIGGFVREVMWDGIDCHRCRMLGWMACSWDEPELRFVHLRPMGSSQRSIYAGRMRHGFGQYFMGTGLSYMLASAAYRLGEPPYVLGSLAMLWGWLKSALRGEPRYADEEFRKFLRRYQWRALFLGKRRAIAAIHRERGIVQAPLPHPER